jgi:hypothetical protein
MMAFLRQRRLYDPQTGQRLALLDAAGKEAGNEVKVYFSHNSIGVIET